MRAEPRHQHDSGFSLVELMIALVVLGVLAAIGFPAYQNYVTRARVSEALVFADGARTRVDLPLAQGQSVLKNGEDLLNSGQKPVDMISGIQWFQPDTKSISGSPGLHPGQHEVARPRGPAQKRPGAATHAQWRLDLYQRRQGGQSRCARRKVPARHLPWWRVDTRRRWHNHGLYLPTRPGDGGPYQRRQDARRLHAQVCDGPDA